MLRDGAELVQTFPRAIMLSLTETESGICLAPLGSFYITLLIVIGDISDRGDAFTLVTLEKGLGRWRRRVVFSMLSGVHNSISLQTCLDSTSF